MLRPSVVELMFGRRVLRLCLGLVILCAAGRAPPARADIYSTSVSGAQIATSLQQTLGGTTVHLHNLGPLINGSYYQANASSIKVPAKVSGIPGQRTYFPLPEETKTVLGNRYGYYFNHVRSTGVFVTANADSFTISITLASNGPALVATCVRVRTGLPCAASGTTRLPSIEWQEARIDIIAKPIVVSRSIAVEVDSVVINGDFDIGQSCELPLVGARLCAAVNRQSQRIRTRVAAQVKNALNAPDVRAAAAAGVRQYLDTNLNEPLVDISRVAMQNGQVMIGLGFGR